MLYTHLYNSPVGDISLVKDEMDLICLSFSNKILNNIEAKIDVNVFKIIIDQLKLNQDIASDGYQFIPSGLIDKENLYVVAKHKKKSY